MTAKLYFFIVVLQMFLAGNLSAQNLSGWITGTVAGKPIPDTLIFGVHQNATFCTDSALGEAEAPPIPPSDIFSFRFINPRLGGDGGTFCFGQGRGDLIGSKGIDLRSTFSPASVDTFRIFFQPGNAGFPLELTWQHDLGLLWSSVFLREISGDLDNCPPSTINMLTQTSHSILCGDIIGLRIFISRPVGVEQEPGHLPKEFGLMQNYPNPFNPSTVIPYQLSEQSNVTLKVYDVLGREVATLVKEIKPPGYYTATWDASGLPGGVYLYRLQAGSFVANKKMILLD